MYEISVQLKENQIGTISFPEKIEEVSLNDYCEFMSQVIPFQKWLSELPENTNLLTPQIQWQYIQKMIKCLSAFSGEDFGAFYGVELGDYIEHINSFVNSDKSATVDLQATADSLFRIYELCWYVMAGYKGQYFSQDYTFTYKGEQYIIQGIQRSSLTQELLPPNVTVQEALEVLDLKRKIDASDMPLENKLFGKFLRVMGAIARKEGEQLPVGDIECKRFIEERATHFQDIDAKTALDIDCFFFGRWKLVEQMISILSYGMPLSQQKEHQNKQKQSVK